MSMSQAEILFENALRLMPWGTQTNAKRPIAEFSGAMPLFVERARGCRIYDLSGNEFIDYRSALGPIILGYCYEDVDQAVRAQQSKGVLFSMSSPIETELAAKMIELVPGLEQVRFLKTGGDACSAAVRIARAYTGKDKIISVGYHGWHDTFGAIHPHFRGVPACLSELIYDAPLNDLERIETILRQDADNISCVIAVTFSWNDAPNVEYVQGLRRLCDEYGILLIFDEVLTGFRLATGGAAEYFGVKPDLAVYAKALANGYPISAFGGARKIMAAMDKTMITVTHAGDALSIAAALATLEIIHREQVISHIHHRGEALMAGMTELLACYEIPAKIRGLPVGFSLVPNQALTELEARKLTRAERAIFENGIFSFRYWFLNYSHSQQDIALTLEKLESAFKSA